MRRFIPHRFFLYILVILIEAILLILLFPHQRVWLWRVLLLGLIVSFLIGKHCTESFFVIQKGIKRILILLTVCASLFLLVEGKGYIESLRFQILEQSYCTAAIQAIDSTKSFPNQSYHKLETVTVSHLLALDGVLYYQKSDHETLIYFQNEETFFRSSGFVYVQNTQSNTKKISLPYDKIQWIADDWAFVKLY